MNRFITSFAFLALAPTLSFAQAAPAAAPSTTPVADALRDGLARSSKRITAAAEAMPADKFSFKPTPDQSTFAHLTIHIAESNYLFCSKVSGTAAPEGAKLTEADGKDKLVAAVKNSFEFCSTALAKVDDSHLGDQIPLFGGHNVSRAGVILILSGSWADHYGAQAMYLRLNGVVPPTAQPAAH
ncbi:MAG: DinB family protein [Acidobacteria bacterium]|nr:DinB family protein [Acidobacteriota bacterium]MBS1864890.1 DinB family protein [Acidobacteriota bacterium]